MKVQWYIGLKPHSNPMKDIVELRKLSESLAKSFLPRIQLPCDAMGFGLNGLAHVFDAIMKFLIG